MSQYFRPLKIYKNPKYLKQNRKKGFGFIFNNFKIKVSFKNIQYFRKVYFSKGH